MTYFSCIRLKARKSIYIKTKIVNQPAGIIRFNALKVLFYIQRNRRLISKQKIMDISFIYICYIDHNSDEYLMS